MNHSTHAETQWDGAASASTRTLSDNGAGARDCQRLNQCWQALVSDGRSEGGCASVLTTRELPDLPLRFVEDYSVAPG